MRKLETGDIKNILEYEKIRDEFRSRIIALKKYRRINVGPKVCLVFENRDTLTFQIQEMMRAERLVKDGAIAEEIEVYNNLIPDTGELSVTLFIEIVETSIIKQELLGFLGLDEPNVVKIIVSEKYETPGQFEEGRSREDKISSVHYVRFAFSPEAQAAFCAPEANVEIVIDHPNYQHRVTLDETSRRSLAQDFAD